MHKCKCSWGTGTQVHKMNFYFPASATTHTIWPKKESTDVQWRKWMCANYRTENSIRFIWEKQRFIKIVSNTDSIRGPMITATCCDVACNKKSQEIHIGKIYSRGKSIVNLHMQIEYIQNRFAKFNKFALLWWREEKVVINSTCTFEMVHETKRERAKNTHLSDGFQAEQSIGVLQQQFLCLQAFCFILETF